MPWKKAVQYVDTFRNEAEAESALAWLRTQVDYVGGRILRPSDVKPGWRVQAFFEDCAHDLPLPEGCLRVVVPPALAAALYAG